MIYRVAARSVIEVRRDCPPKPPSACASLGLIYSREPFDVGQVAERFSAMYQIDADAIRRSLVELQAAKAGGSVILASAVNTVSVELGNWDALSFRQLPQRGNCHPGMEIGNGVYDDGDWTC